MLLRNVVNEVMDQLDPFIDDSCSVEFEIYFYPATKTSGEVDICFSDKNNASAKMKFIAYKGLIDKNKEEQA